MDQTEHNLVVELLKNDRAIAIDFCRSKGRPLPAYPTIHVENTNLTVVGMRKLQVDLAFMLTGGKTKHMILTEVQLSPDKDKYRAWVGYLVQSDILYECPLTLLIVTLTLRTYGWLHRFLAHPSADLADMLALKALIMGPGDILPVLRRGQVRARPELAALSFLAHRRGLDRRLAADVEAAVARGLLGLAKRGHTKALEYLDVLHRWMKRSTRKTMETMWTDRGYIPVGPGKKLYNRGRRDGLDEGKAAGEAQGEAQGKAEALLLVLQGRGVRVSAKGRARIRAERNTATLDAWLLKASVAHRESDVLGDAQRNANGNGNGNGKR